MSKRNLSGLLGVSGLSRVEASVTTIEIEGRDVRRGESLIDSWEVFENTILYVAVAAVVAVECGVELVFVGDKFELFR